MPIDKGLIQSLPKVELHVHLDCSLSYQVVKRLDPTISEEFYHQNFIGPALCHDLKDYLDRAEHALQLMQTPRNLTMVVHDLFRQFKEDGVVYAEVRFAPLLHLRDGMKPDEVVSVVTNAVKNSMNTTGIKGGLILCTLRHFTYKQSMLTADLTCRYFGKGIVGFDIASDESAYPLDNHLDAFKKVRRHGVPCTAHAGEARGAESVWETLKKLHPIRIGHGVRSIEDKDLLNHFISLGIHLEICPTSNIQTRSCQSMHHHPIDMMYRKGISISINTDARTISNTDLAREYEVLHDYFKWNIIHFYRCNKEAIKHAFTSDEVRKEILKILDCRYAKAISQIEMNN